MVAPDAPAYTRNVMLKVILPICACVMVLLGLIATEPPPTAEEQKRLAQREMLRQIQSEQDALLETLDGLEDQEQELRLRLAAIESAASDHPALQDSLQRLQLVTAKHKTAAEASIVEVRAEMEHAERKAEDWVRKAYDLTPDALPPGYLARVLWKADGAAIAEASKLAHDLKVTLHISETSAQAAASRVRKFLKSGYTRRTLISAAGALATLAVFESAEPVFSWAFNLWWKLLAAILAGLAVLGLVIWLQRRRVLG